MSDQVNAILTAKDVEGIRERLRKIQALSKGGNRVHEQCRMVAQILSKGQRKVVRMERKDQQPKITRNDV